MKLVPSVIIKESFPAGRRTSHGEKKIFNAFRKIKNFGGWYCFHSLDLPEHSYKSSGEIDFLIAGPEGIIALEVKSGNVSFRNGVWDYVAFRKKESPFQQAESAIRALLKRCDENKIIDISSQKFCWGYGVIFTGVKFTEKSSAWDLDVVLDEYQIHNDEDYLEKYLKRLIRYWQDHHHRRNLLIDEQVKDLARYFRPEFELVPTLRASVEEAEGAFVKLTEDQYTGLDAMRENDRVIFDGGAGTGKTFLAMEEARRKCNEGKSVLFLCYNPVLAEYLNHNLKHDKLRIVSVHSLFYDTLDDKRGFVRQPNLVLINSDTYIQELPARLIEQLSAKSVEKYDVLIIDEAQDLLSENYLLVIDYFIEGGIENGVWRIFIDSENQKGITGIFEQSAFNSVNKFSRGIYRLSKNVRNTNQIVNSTKIWTGLDFSSYSSVNGPELKIYYYKDKTENINKLKEIIKSVISQDLQPGYLTFLSAVPFSKSVMSDEIFRRYRITEIDRSAVIKFPLNSYTYSMIADFKGLENSVIIITDIDEESFKIPELFYVAFTRTRYVLHIFIPENLRKNLDSMLNKNKLKMKEALNETRT